MWKDPFIYKNVIYASSITATTNTCRELTGCRPVPNPFFARLLRSLQKPFEETVLYFPSSLWETEFGGE